MFLGKDYSMIFSRSSLALALLTTTLLSACGSVSSPLNASQKNVQTALTAPATPAIARTNPVTAAKQVKTTPEKTTIAKQTIELKPVSKEAVQQQAQLRKEAKTTPATTESNASPYTPEELAAIKALEASLSEELQAEDRQHADKQSFSIKSADHGKDIDIEMFLYNPKYSKSAKFWGIKNANDLLMAGRSPLRRWLLKRKLEGLWAPAGFEQQILFWVEQADLLRVSGVNRDQAWLLVANGITSVPDLARRNIVELGALKLSLTVMAFQYGMTAPSLDELKAWTEEAKTLEPVIY
jgi:hypothetical protein